MVRVKYMALVFGLALVATACAAAEEPQAQAPQAQAPSQPQAQAPPVFVATPTTVGSVVAPAAASEGDGTSEGVQVHGQWTIEVRDPDGTVVDRREFENALTNDGEDTLVRIMSGVGTVSPQGWSVWILDRASVMKIWLEESTGTLTVEAALRDASRPTSAIVLSGSGSASTDFFIGPVQTVLVESAPIIFTRTDRTADNILVKANQTVYVEVEISFS